MSKLVIQPDGTKACLKAPFFRPALVYRLLPGFAERCMSWLYQLFGGKQRLESGRYIVRWSNSCFTLEVK